MADPAAALTALLRAASIEDHDEVLKAANAAVKASKGSNLEAQHTRVVALLKLDRFDDALRSIADGGDKVAKECAIEKAYALYKTGQLDEAEKVVGSIPGSSRGVDHLTAQIAYRAEKFEDASELYQELAEDEARRRGEENDLKINSLATNAQLEWNGQGHVLDAQQRQPSREDLEAFETAYNAACTCIGRGDLNRASVLLKRARDLCEASDELSEEEKKAELLPILIQHAYVFTCQGKEAEAEALQKSIMITDIPEASTRAIAQNNQSAIGSQEKNPFLTQRVTQSAAALSGTDNLFGYQAAVLSRNQYALDLQAQKFNGVEASAFRRAAKVEVPSASPEIAGLGVIGAAAHAHLETGKAALKEILPMLEKRPYDIGLLLTIIQLYVQTQNPGPALTLLETFLRRLEAATTPDHEDVRFAPGLVAVAVALYRLQGRQNSIRTELSKASAHWRSRPKESATSLLREAGVELLKSSNPKDVASAGATFETLVAKDDKDTIAAAGLVASFATSDFAKIEPYLSSLTPVDRLTVGTDVQSLIAAGVASVPTAAAPAGNNNKKRAAEAGPDKPAGSAAASSSKRRRKTRLPKSYEEGKKPDPERWLPLRDRSTYRPKGKKGKKRAQEATQGGVVREEETLELVGGAGAVKVEKAPAGGGGGGKKKKKGKK